MDKFIINNVSLLSTINSSIDKQDEFIDILEIIINLNYTLIMKDDDLLNEIYTALYSNIKVNEDLKIINKLLEKTTYCEEEKFDSLLNKIIEISKNEDTEFKNINTPHFKFETKNSTICYNFDALFNSIRNIKTLDSLKKAMLIFTLNHTSIEDFISSVKIILNTVIFDVNIIESINRLNDGFEVRKKEIIYHLYCIQSEVPSILNRGFSSYSDIGEHMSIRCSPERARMKELRKQIGEFSINCELHTKMRTLSSKAPDRIYFCPSLPYDVGEFKKGSIYIYKITKHA